VAEGKPFSESFPGGSVNRRERREKKRFSLFFISAVKIKINCSLWLFETFL